MIAIIDYGSGNLKSVYNAFRYLGASARVCDKPAMLDKAEKIVFPGVGSSEDAIAGLKKRGMVEPMIGNIKNGKAFLGICLGLQLLFENSEESGGTECMGLIKGNVPVFSKKKGLKIPQIGWNTVKIENKKCPLFRGIRDNSYFYFVHSYYAACKEKAVVAASAEYGIKYTAAVWKDNLFAVQFHPERSQKNGLKLLDNFIKL